LHGSRATATKECVMHLHYVKVVFGRGSIDVGGGWSGFVVLCNYVWRVGAVYFGTVSK
jgi:hypothetical protein